jgi:PAS domain S-box-containing protein
MTAQVRDRERIEILTRRLAEAEERYRVLLTVLPQGLIYYTGDGSVISANPAASEILGVDLAAVKSWPPPGLAVHEDGSPYRPEELPMRKVLRTGEVDDAVAGVPHGQTGETRWLRVTAVPAVRDEQGRPRTVYAIFTDLTGHRRTEAALRESAGLVQQLRDSNVLGVADSTEQGVCDANDAFLELIGASRDELAAGLVTHQSITPPDWADRNREARERLRRNAAFEPQDREYRHRAGHRVPVLVGDVVVEQHPLRWVTFAVDLTPQLAAERERAELREREEAASAEAEHARERLAFLLRAGAMVAAPQDRRQMLEHAAELVVPALADHCVVFLPTVDGALRATSLAHSDPARASVLAEFRRHKIPAVGPMSLQVAYTTGTSQLLRDVEARLSQWHDLDPGLITLLTRLRADTVLSVPLLVGGRSAGVLALARDAGRPPFAETDIAVVEEFAHRLSDALTAADAFARSHTIAETLQRSLLPGTLPDIAGLELAARYLPASDGAHVGGDWYDAFSLRGGAIGLVIGDVAGHNITSASVMGQVRSLLRAYALDHPHPGTVLQHTNDALIELLPDALATAVYAVLDPATGEFTYANAGHPPPLVTTRAGDVACLDDAPGTMLGATQGAALQTGHRQLQPGAGLLLYTDGLIEDRDRDISSGLSALAAVLRDACALSAGDQCTAVESMLCGSPSRADDVCLLAIRRVGG